MPSITYWPHYSQNYKSLWFRLKGIWRVQTFQFPLDFKHCALVGPITECGPIVVGEEGSSTDDTGKWPERGQQKFLNVEYKSFTS